VRRGTTPDQPESDSEDDASGDSVEDVTGDTGESGGEDEDDDEEDEEVVLGFFVAALDFCLFLRAYLRSVRGVLGPSLLHLVVFFFATLGSRQ
jgi:hypothetical protein